MSHPPIVNPSIQARVCREGYAGLFIRAVHGSKFCPRKPLNTTQRVGATL